MRTEFQCSSIKNTKWLVAETAPPALFGLLSIVKIMQVGDGVATGVFGLYELSNDGKVLYSRPRASEGLRPAAQAIVGQDFFNDICVCQNIGDLRTHFRQFITGDRSVDTFVFECIFDQEIVRAKVFMTRAYEHDHEKEGGIVIMDIRRAA